MKDRTVLIVAHRLSSIIKSDYIVVMEKGKIIDIGSHEELLERSKRYRFLYQLQFADNQGETIEPSSALNKTTENTEGNF
jgi:subfamily B ATP-binding cassette protein MsbA